METIEAILSRRSTRQFSPGPLPEGAIETILRSAMAAPSAGNEQPWHFVVLDDRATLNRVPEIHPYSGMVTEAPAAILVCGERALEIYKGFWTQDCSAATMSILLAAHALGLGAVWLGLFPLRDRIKGMRDLLDIPKNIIPFSLVPIGISAESKPPANRYDPARLHRNRWGSSPAGGI